MKVANNYGKCALLMPLYYAIQCYALEGAIPELSFLAKPHQPNGHDNQMVLVAPLEGNKSDTPTTHRHPWHLLNYRCAHNYDQNHDNGHDSHGLSSHEPDLGPRHFMHVGYSSTI